MIRLLKKVVLTAMIITLLFLIVSMITGFGEEVRHTVTQYAILIFGISYVILDLLTDKKKEGAISPRDK